MSNDVKIKLKTVDDIFKFVNICSNSQFKDCDIKLIDGSSVIRAKSLIGICALSSGKSLIARIVTDDCNIMEDFHELMKEFEVR